MNGHAAPLIATFDGSGESQSPQGATSSASNPSVPLRDTPTITGEKRKRNPLACEPCRQRKAKCNGDQPVCDQCKPRNLECHYRTYQRKTQRTDQYIQELEDRLRRLEGHHGLAQSLPPPNYDNRLDALSSAATLVGQQAEYGWNEDTDEVADESINTADGMGVPGDGAQSAFFGKSAISTVFQTIRPNANARRAPSQPSPVAVPPTPRSTNSSLPHTLASQDDNGLPPRELADALMHAYWHYVNTLYPYLDERTYRERYARFWTDPHDADFLDVGILNLIFALGAHFLGDRLRPHEAVALAARFFKRARDILGARLMSVGSLRSVQALLLMGQFAQSSNQPNFCWNTVGLAVRVCQGLGLHIEAAADEDTLSDVDREIRRRTYWTCFVMDRMVSTTFGRPTAIREDMSSVNLPSVHPAISLVPEADTPAGQPDLIHFFIATVNLSRVKASVLDALYGQAGALVSERLPLARLLELDALLKAWEDALPDFLQPLTPVEKIPWPSIFRQRNVLRMRALNVRLLLHRPCLLLAARDSDGAASRASYPTPDLALETCTVRQSAKICLEAARQSIELVHATYRDINTTGAHWYSLYYAFQGAVCILLLLQMNGDAPGGRHSEVPFETRDEAALEKATEILAQLSSKSPTAATCYASLTQVRARAGRSRRVSVEPEPSMSTTSAAALDPLLGGPPAITADVAHLGLSALWAPDASAHDWSFDTFFSSSSLPGSGGVGGPMLGGYASPGAIAGFGDGGALEFDALAMFGGVPAATPAVVGGIAGPTEAQAATWSWPSLGI